MTIEKISTAKSFSGDQERYKHTSEVLGCEMVFSVYLPPQAAEKSVPVLYWLSGLTCTDENFTQKAGAQKYAAEYGVALVMPDTSPRGEGIPDDAEKAYDFGLGAGFYVNATQEPWNKNYQMYNYIVHELPALINNNFAVDASRVGIFGHSMGGHGALTIALNNPDKYQSVSAFSPIVSPMNCPWGEKALSNYLGSDKETWKQYDTVHLVQNTKVRLPVLVDQGTGDNFLDEQLKTSLLKAAAEQADFPMEIRMQSGYDHSYFFISTFIKDHIKFHSDNFSAA